MTLPLSLRQRWLYSCTSAGVNIIMTTVSTWLLYFYAPPPDSGRPEYLSVTLVGILLTASRFWDAIIDPLIGYWSDSMRSRWGRRRPFLIVGAPATAVTLLLLWTPPASTSGITNACYFLVVTIAFFTSLTFVSIPYDSSLPEMASSPAELVNLSMWKNIFGTTGVLIGAVAAAPLFSTAGPVRMALVLAAVGLASVFLTLMALKEKPRPLHQTISLSSSIRITLKNQQFLILFLSTVLVQTAYAMLLANLPYFVTLVVGRPESEVSLFQGTVVLTMMLAAPVWNWLSQRYANRSLLIAAMVGFAATTALHFTVGLVSGVNPTLYTLILLSSMAPFLGGYFILSYAMMAAVIDYDELLTQQRREAFHYGAFSLAAGLGLSLATLLVPRIFTEYGYTAAQPLGVRVVFLIAAALGLLGAIAFLNYRLGDTIEETKQNLNL